MKIGIMQPYLFPYIGYFQLIAAVDTFIIYDDVQFIKNGWINRNRFLVRGDAHIFTFSVKNDSTFKNINERFFADNHSYETKKFFKFLHGNYGKAPHFAPTYALVQEILLYEENKVATKLERSLRFICAYLGIDVNFLTSSKMNIGTHLQGQERVLEICRKLDATCYVNAIGGRDIYSRSEFETVGIQLNFIRSKFITYPQFDHQFVPNLSILDVLMFNSQDQLREHLKACDLI